MPATCSVLTLVSSIIREWEKKEEEEEEHEQEEKKEEIERGKEEKNVIKKVYLQLTTSHQVLEQGKG